MDGWRCHFAFNVHIFDAFAHPQLILAHLQLIFTSTPTYHQFTIISFSSSTSTHPQLTINSASINLQLNLHSPSLQLIHSSPSSVTQCSETQFLVCTN
jgi:hypothetical protein